MAKAEVRIERLATVDQYHACESLQARVWGLDETDVVPLHLLLTIQKSGGLVLGAYDESGEMIGFLLGFLGAHDGDVRRPKHCSHMMGVVESWRGRGVGHRLKLAQRDHALSQGLDLVTWTYDPLESLNAALNVGKLGAVCSTYIRDLYGPMTDTLNAGLSTDRFLVEWWIGSEHVERALEGAWRKPSLSALLDRGGRLLVAGRSRADGLAEPSAVAPVPDSGPALVEVPASIRAIKTADMDLAIRWRAATREAFEACFAEGYAVTDFVREARDDRHRSVYVLTRSGEEDRCGSSESS